MKQNVLIVAGLVLSVSIFLNSCKKDSEAPPVDTTNDGTFKVFSTGNVTTVQNLMADTIIGIAPTGQPYGTGRFTFFSLEQSALVPNSDSATTKWDLGFRGTTIIVNGGSSGPGNGGAFIWNGVFNDLTQVPTDSIFRADSASTYAITTGSGKGWYNYNGSANLVTPLPGKVLVIKTANGKHAKVEILNYYKGGETPSSTASDEVKLSEQRYYTFRYVYQPDGSGNF